MSTLGISSWFGYDLPLEDRLEMIAQAGFSTTSLWLGEEEEMVPNGQADLMPAMVRNKGLILDNIHAPFRHCNLLWSESIEDNNLVLSEYQSAIAYCAKHRIPVVVMHISQSRNPPPQTREGIQRIYNLVRQAEDRAVILALENTLRPDYLEPIFKDICSPNLGFCYDSSHDFIAETLRGQSLEKWGSLLVTTHLSDNNGTNDDHLIPGRGTIDWRMIKKHFPGNSYQGTLMLEVDSPEANKGFTPVEFLKTSYEKIRELAMMFV